MNRRGSKNITILNKLVAHGEDLEYIEGQWWYEGKSYDTLPTICNEMMIPVSIHKLALESYVNTKTHTGV